MSITYLSQQQIGDALSCAWKKQLGTSQDPANGKWYTKGANGDKIGLYGGLTDSVPANVTLNTAAATVTSSTIICDTTTVDNRNGLDPGGTFKLTYENTTSTSSTHTVTESVTLGEKFTIQVDEGVAKESDEFSVAFTFTSTESETDTTTDSTTVEQDVSVTPPAGKVYQGVLQADVQEMSCPYTVVIRVTGTTETWFENTVNGHYNYSADAGTAFGWIKSDSCAGSDSASYSDAGNGVGEITLTGTVKMSQNVNFKTSVKDITDTYTG